MSLEDQIDRAADLIRHAHHAVALTGAGVSTPSGIPDFRSPTSGLWEKDNPMVVASITSFRADPQVFYNWLRPLAELILYAQPNAAHLALAHLEQRGLIKAVITQNIDGLHQKAGTRRVLEVHGHMRQATCIRCYTQVPANSLVARFLLTGEAPRCECGGVFKPDAILFGEQLPVRVLNQAIAEVRRCDLLLVAGSSLHVVPAADLPFLAAENAANTIIVNLEPTDFDPRADLVIHGDVAEVLPRIVELLPG
jgi:NAD-dependent protein deacetylase/lipoamidase